MVCGKASLSPFPFVGGPRPSAWCHPPLPPLPTLALSSGRWAGCSGSGLGVRPTPALHLRGLMTWRPRTDTPGLVTLGGKPRELGSSPGLVSGWGVARCASCRDSGSWGWAGPRCSRTREGPGGPLGGGQSWRGRTAWTGFHHCECPNTPGYPHGSPTG